MIKRKDVAHIIVSGALVQKKLKCGGLIVGILREKNEGGYCVSCNMTNGSRGRELHPVTLKKISLYNGTKKTIKEIEKKHCCYPIKTDFCVVCLTFYSPLLPSH